MIDYDDYFGGLTEEEYQEQVKEHYEWLDHICKCDDQKAYRLLDKFKENLFACEFVSDEEAEMLYNTFINWKDRLDNFSVEVEEQLDNTQVNKMCQSELDHEWECYTITTAGTIYICKKCNTQKIVPFDFYSPPTITI